MNIPRQRSAEKPSGELQAILRHNVRLDRITYTPVEQLKSYGRALRKRSDEAAEGLKNSVRSFGIVVPILVDPNRTIIAGEGVVAAAKAVGYTEVPTICIDHLDTNEVRLLRIALNRLAETSEWDKVELAAEFGELLTLDTDLAYEVTGFGTIEIDNMIHAPAVDDEADPDDDAILPGLPGSEISRAGDLWDLGDHCVLCGSSLEMESLATLMGTELARMVLADGPYNVKIAGHVSGLGKIRHREFLQASGEMSEPGFIDFQTRSTTTLAAFCEDGALLYLFIDWRHQWEMLSGIRAAGLTMINLAVWVKRAGSMGSFYRSQHELVYISKKGTAPHRNNVQLGRYGRNRTNCWFYPGANTFGGDRDEQLAIHPTPKNVSLLSDAIRDATHRGEIVLDGFLGSGSTLIAAERTGRVCRGIEIDPLYVDAIIHRWEKATGRLASLRGTGEVFEAVALRRAGEAEDTQVAIARPEIIARTRIRAVA